MPTNIKIRKVWLYSFCIWVVIAIPTILLLFTPIADKIIDKTGIYLIHFSIFIFVALSWILIDRSNVFKYIATRFKGRFLPIFMGVMFILMGVSIYQTGYTGKYLVQVPSSVGIFGALLGLSLIAWGLFGKVSVQNGYYWCQNCKKKYSTNHVAIKSCSICGSSLEYKIELVEK